jgi:hypothetical protein
MPMNRNFQQNRLACISLACLIADWLLFCIFINSGIKYHSETWWLKVVTMWIVFFAPASALLAIAGLIFDVRKKVAIVSLFLSLVSTLLIFSLGG